MPLEAKQSSNVPRSVSSNGGKAVNSSFQYVLYVQLVRTSLHNDNTTYDFLNTKHLYGMYLEGKRIYRGVLEFLSLAKSKLII